MHTGVKGGELKVGVGSRVERAEAPVSPGSSAPRPLDFRRWRGIFLGGVKSLGSVCRYKGEISFQLIMNWKNENVVGAIIILQYR